MDEKDCIALSLKAMGLSKQKEKQEEAVLAFLSSKDVFVSLPTGYGKSIIYGILPLVFDHKKGNQKFFFLLN